MTDKELKHLSRMELIDIIYTLQKQNEQAQALLQKTQAKLEERTLKINEAGSIAEAAVKLNGVFESTQAAADQYLESVQAANQSVDARLADAEAQKAAILQAAERQAAEIVRVAQEQAHSITEQEEKESGEQWDAFQRKAEEFLSAHKELSSFIQK